MVELELSKVFSNLFQKFKTEETGKPFVGVFTLNSTIHNLGEGDIIEKIAKGTKDPRIEFSLPK